MLNNEFFIGQAIALYKPQIGSEGLTIYGEIAGIRRHWDGNPDHLQVQLDGLEVWLDTYGDWQVTATPRERENDCN